MKCLTNKYLLTIAILGSFSYNTGTQIQATISLGELVDKITILSIKKERIADPEKLKNITTELELLLLLFNEHIGNRTDIAHLMTKLKKTNEALWDIEDILRVKERIKDFGDEFIQLARNVYITNDKRCSLKRKIDLTLGSQIIEEKSYEAYL